MNYVENLYNRREAKYDYKSRHIATKVCWFIPNDKLVKYVAQKPTLEVMGGSGFFAGLVRDAKGDIISTDNHSAFFNKSPYFEMEMLSANDAIKKYGKNRRLFMAWPMMHDDAIKALRLFHKINPKGEFIYVGEGLGGCTADDDFFEYLEKHYDESDTRISIKRWDAINDFCSIYIPK